MGIIRDTLLDFGLEIARRVGHGEHILEGVDASVLEPYVGLAAAHGDAARDGAAVGVPHDTSCRLGGKHGDGVIAHE